MKGKNNSFGCHGKKITAIREEKLNSYETFWQCCSYAKKQKQCHIMFKIVKKENVCNEFYNGPHWSAHVNQQTGNCARNQGILFLCAFLKILAVALDNHRTGSSIGIKRTGELSNDWWRMLSL